MYPFAKPPIGLMAHANSKPSLGSCHMNIGPRKKHVRLPASAVEGICNDGIWGTFFSGKAMLVLFKSGEPAFPDSP